jgi:hypothetical protein
MRENPANTRPTADRRRKLPWRPTRLKLRSIHERRTCSFAKAKVEFAQKVWQDSSQDYSSRGSYILKTIVPNHYMKSFINCAACFAMIEKIVSMCAARAGSFGIPVNRR